ncbi:LysE family translocator [Sodalis sp. dw_96]|uniref:LysE family translocator n=1 Tax=Sodalis sp. dw_96 TaxID=2719794 RepID=UPI001BD5E42C|nr:LysE family translocator [Sodalis sp. dw_96]
MLSFEMFIPFFITTIIFAYIPGPAMLYTAAQTISRGQSSGLMAALGIHLGGYGHVIAAAAGLTLLFHAVPVLYIMVKIMGAVYLVWLGIQMFRTRAPTEFATSDFRKAKSVKRAFFESVAVEILNPKTAIFYLAYLPQFIDVSGSFPVWLQFIALGSIVNLTFSSADIVCVLLAEFILSRLKKSNRMQKVMQKIGGAIFISLGVNVALQRN